MCGGGFLCTGPDEAAALRQLEIARYRVAFYASTPSYRPVLALHGWEDLGDELNRMTRAGKWREMAQRVPDEVLHAFAMVAPYPALKGAIEQRFGGISDSVELGLEPGLPAGLQREIVQDIQEIDSPCSGPQTSWQSL